MSSDASAIEIGVSNESVKTTGTDTKPQVQFDVERLHQQIQELERELALERERRKQVVTRYERLLEQERRTADESNGWLGSLF